MPAPFQTFTAFRRLLADLPGPILRRRRRRGAGRRPDETGGLAGRLEDVAIWMAGWQGTARPAVEAPWS